MDVAKHGHHDAADGFRGPEYGLAVDKESAAVKRAGKRNSKELLGHDSRPVGHDQQDEELQDQDSLHGASPIDGPASRLNPRANLQVAI
jgi:hypothetical protein